MRQTMLMGLVLLAMACVVIIPSAIADDWEFTTTLEPNPVAQGETLVVQLEVKNLADVEMKIDQLLFHGDWMHEGEYISKITQWTDPVHIAIGQSADFTVNVSIRAYEVEVGTYSRYWHMEYSLKVGTSWTDYEINSDAVCDIVVVAASDVDRDGDGIPNSEDAFPNDPNEWVDTDFDGVGDNSDAFPTDRYENKDTDGDGYGDNGDAFPEDPLEWLDTDGDGYGDNEDVFPDDPLEWVDTDGDTHGDNGDAFLNDPLEWDDTDGDGSGDNGDAFPDDMAASVDTDGDGHPDEWNTERTKKDSTTGLTIDQFPNDPEEWKKDDESPSLGLVGALMAILVAVVVAYTRRMRSG